MEVGKTKVRVLNEYGNKFAIGVYCGVGIPSAEVKASQPTLKHYAIFVLGEMRYYPAGFHTLQIARDDD